MRSPAKICRRCGWSQLRNVGVGDARARRPRAAAQHAVVAAEEDLGVLAVRDGRGSRDSRRSRSAVHSQASPIMPSAAGGRRAGGIRADRRRCRRRAGRGSRGAPGCGGVAPRAAAASSRLLVPGRRLLPLGLGREARAVRAGEGVGLEPGDVDDRPVRVERLAAAPCATRARRPSSRRGARCRTPPSRPSASSVHHSRRS